MAMPRWEDAKIAIVGAMEYKNRFNESQISWFENIEELNCNEFDVVLDASKDGRITIIVDNENILIHDGNDDMLSHLKSWISVMIDMKIMDVDFEDIKTVLDKGCTFKSLSTSRADVKKNIESWIKENLEDLRSSLFIHIQGNDFSILDISDLIDRINKSIELTEDDVMFSISGEEFNDADVKISLWYR